MHFLYFLKTFLGHIFYSIALQQTGDLPVVYRSSRPKLG